MPSPQSRQLPWPDQPTQLALGSEHLGETLRAREGDPEELAGLVGGSFHLNRAICILRRSGIALDIPNHVQFRSEALEPPSDGEPASSATDVPDYSASSPASITTT